MSKWRKGESGNPKGRPKGTPNKTTAELRDALMAPFDPERFAKWAKSRQDLYYTQILTKLLPKDLNIKREFNSLNELLASLPEQTLINLAKSIQAESEREKEVLAKDRGDG